MSFHNNNNYYNNKHTHNTKSAVFRVAVVVSIYIYIHTHATRRCCNQPFTTCIRTLIYSSHQTYIYILLNQHTNVVSKIVSLLFCIIRKTKKKKAGRRWVRTRRRARGRLLLILQWLITFDACMMNTLYAYIDTLAAAAAHMYSNHIHHRLLILTHICRRIQIHHKHINIH